MVEKKTAVKKAPAKKAPVKTDAIQASVTRTVKKAEQAPTEAAVDMSTLFPGKYHYANGKRKTAVARVRVYEAGQGEIVVNGRNFQEYFKVGTLFGLIKSPLKMANLEKFAITAKIIGGGIAAQADALRHGIAKALIEMSSENRTLLKKAGQLTRDDRIVERKKPGRRKARRGQQWVKR